MVAWMNYRNSTKDLEFLDLEFLDLEFSIILWKKKYLITLAVWMEPHVKPVYLHWND